MNRRHGSSLSLFDARRANRPGGIVPPYGFFAGAVPGIHPCPESSAGVARSGLQMTCFSTSSRPLHGPTQLGLFQELGRIIAEGYRRGSTGWKRRLWRVAFRPRAQLRSRRESAASLPWERGTYASSTSFFR